MATLDEILEDWDNDSIINDNHISDESVRVPKLHAKYVRHLAQAKLSIVKKNNDYSSLKKLKFRYYRGELTRDELREYNWEQWQGVKPMKNEMDQFLSGDDDLVKLKLSIDILETKIEVIQSILGQIKSRDWQLKTMLDHKKFLAGN